MKDKVCIGFKSYKNKIVLIFNGVERIIPLKKAIILGKELDESIHDVEVFKLENEYYLWYEWIAQSGGN